jgi:hypothetical protein
MSLVKIEVSEYYYTHLDGTNIYCVKHDELVNAGLCEVDYWSPCECE